MEVAFFCNCKCFKFFFPHVLNFLWEVWPASIYQTKNHKVNSTRDKFRASIPTPWELVFLSCEPGCRWWPDASSLWSTFFWWFWIAMACPVLFLKHKNWWGFLHLKAKTGCVFCCSFLGRKMIYIYIYIPKVVLFVFFWVSCCCVCCVSLTKTIP